MSKKEKAKGKPAKNPVEVNPVATETPREEATDAASNLVLVGRALSDPKRLELLRRIADLDGTSCMDLRTCLGINPATLSHHMRQLEGAGLIETHRDGKLMRATLRRKTLKNYAAQIKVYLGS